MKFSNNSKILIFFAVLIVILSFSTFVVSQEQIHTLNFFWGDGCPACNRQKPFIEELRDEYSWLEINEYEVWYDSGNQRKFQSLAGEYGLRGVVPTTIIGDEFWEGFDNDIKREIENYLFELDEKIRQNKNNNQDDENEEDEKQNDKICVRVFLHGECPQCNRVRPLIEELKDKYNVNIYIYDVMNEEDSFLYEQYKELYGIKIGAYPVVFIGDNYLMGETAITEALEEQVIDCIEKGCECPYEKIKPFTPISPRTDDVTHEEKQTIDFFGFEIDIGKMPLVFSTFVIAFIDGFNPCSLWVLTFLLGIVILTGSRKKIFLIGFTYLLVAGIAYGVFILGFLTIFAYIGYLTWIRVLVASIAIIFAIVNIKDFFWYKKGISFTIPDSYKPKIFKNVRNLMNPQNSTPVLIIGSALMALGITLVEIPCTAGFPMLWSSIVSAQEIELGYFAMLFLIYLLTYFSVELIIFLSVVFTLRASRFEEKHGRLLKLIGGVIMMALAFVLLFNPDLLNDITGTILLFGGAILVSLIIAWLYDKKVLTKDKSEIENNKENEKSDDLKKENKENEGEKEVQEIEDKKEFKKTDSDLNKDNEKEVQESKKLNERRDKDE